MKTLKVRHAGKGSRPLPGRGALNDLDKGSRTINDYAKAVPTLNPDEEKPLLATFMRKP